MLISKENRIYKVESSCPFRQLQGGGICTGVERGEETDILLYFFFGRPLVLIVCSRPRRSVSCCHLGVPKGRSHVTLVSIDSSSDAG